MSGSSLEYSLENARSLLTVVGIMAVCWLLSERKTAFPFVLMILALSLQGALVALLFAIPNAEVLLGGISGVVAALAGATAEGTRFVFSYLGGGDPPYAPAPGAAPAFIFGFQVLPLILVIASLSAFLWHVGVLKAVIRVFGLLFRRTLGLSGACSTAVSANIFVGNVESSIVIRAYLAKLTRSEVFTVMTVGLAGVAGSTMVAYATILKDVLPNAAGHVLVASIISAPAGVLLARIMVPPAKGEKPGGDVDMSTSLKYDSAMDALARGVQDGLLVAVNVAAMLIVFVALVALVNGLLAAFPDVDGAPLSLQRIMGWAFAPVAYAIGIPWKEAQTAGDLLGVKLFLTEFAAYLKMGAIPAAELSERSRMIMTYALCGFANVASVGITIGGLTQLYPPERRPLILELAPKALLPGFLATLMTASIVAALPPGIFAR